jgi:uncharacterized protein YdhG (YjbR/CyaY superfamily)
MNQKYETAAAYIEAQRVDVQKTLRAILRTIKKAAPGAKEVISYGMPAVKQNRVLACFAAFRNHIGFYPSSSGIAQFKKEISKYPHSKGAVQFPINDPPLDLIARIVEFRVKEDSQIESKTTAPKKR